MKRVKRCGASVGTGESDPERMLAPPPLLSPAQSFPPVRIDEETGSVRTFTYLMREGEELPLAGLDEG